ncbi:MAG: hypothetical protein ACPGO0_04385 [Acidimicrobiales bacterium]
MKEDIELSDKDLSIFFNFEAGTVTFRNFRIETLLPKKLPEFTVGFDEIGKNTVSHFNAGTKPLRDVHCLLALKGRVWIPERFSKLSEAVELFDTLWEGNEENRTKEELNEFKSGMTKTHPVAKLVGIILLLIGIAGVIYYFTVILPNLEL